MDGMDRGKSAGDRSGAGEGRVGKEEPDADAREEGNQPEDRRDAGATEAAIVQTPIGVSGFRSDPLNSVDRNASESAINHLHTEFERVGLYDTKEIRKHDPYKREHAQSFRESRVFAIDRKADNFCGICTLQFPRLLEVQGRKYCPDCLLHFIKVVLLTPRRNTI